MSFTPLVPDITQRVLGLDRDTVAIVRQHIDPEPGEPRGFLADVHDLVYSYLGPGEALNALSLEATRELAKQIEEYAARLRSREIGEETVDLLQWIRHFVAMATASLLYGDENPLALHPELEAAFWDFDHGLGSLLMGVFPSVTARKAYRGRELLVTAFEEYLSLGQHLPGDGRRGASPIVQKRVALALQHGWTLRAAARSELSFLFAGIVNTATTTFWMALHLFASASSGPDNLLSTVRAEITPAFTRNSQDDTLTLSLDKLKTSSPALQALFRECLRQNSDTYSTRLVKSATTLAGSSDQPYQLAKGAIVQISGGTIHADPRIWGPDVGEFKPARFHPSSSSKTATAASSSSGSSTNSKKNDKATSSIGTGTGSSAIHPAAFRGFGGGKTLCPGRHFATLSIQSLVAILITKFDVAGKEEVGLAGNGESEKGRQGKGGVGAKGQGKQGKITIPGKEDGVLPVHVLEPRGKVKVRVRVREARAVVVVV